MNELRRFDLYPFQAEWGAGVDENDNIDGDYCRADEALAAIGERDARIAALTVKLGLVKNTSMKLVFKIDQLRSTIAERDAEIARLTATIAAQENYQKMLRKGVRDAAEVIASLKATIAEKEVHRVIDLVFSQPTETEEEVKALKATVAERQTQIDQLKKFMAFNSRSFEILIGKHDAEVDRHYAEVDLLNDLVMAYHEREEQANESYELEHTAWLAEVRVNTSLLDQLRSALKATAWQPFSGTSVPCANYPGCGVIQDGNLLVVWCGQDEAAIYLPANYRLCQLVQP